MRTTTTLDSDVAVLADRVIRDRHPSFKTVVNDALRGALRPQQTGEPYRVRTADPPEARTDLTKTLQLTAELDDLELAPTLELGK